MSGVDKGTDPCTFIPRCCFPVMFFNSYFENGAFKMSDLKKSPSFFVTLVPCKWDRV